jgi:hypothetical protein
MNQAIRIADRELLIPLHQRFVKGIQHLAIREWRISAASPAPAAFFA